MKLGQFGMDTQFDVFNEYRVFRTLEFFGLFHAVQSFYI